VRGRAWRGVGLTGTLGVLTLGGAGLLYGPLLLVSGAGQLFGNAYVRALGAGVFWQSLPAYVWRTEGWLSGHRWLGPLPLLAVLLGLWRARRAGAGLGPTPAGRAPWRLVGPCLWFMAVPYLLVVVQRVQPPERTLFYKSLMLCVLAALLADWVLARLAPLSPRCRWVPALGAAAGLLAATSQLAVLTRHNEQELRQWQTYRQPMAWLATQPPGPVLAPDPVPRFLLRFFAHTEFRGQGWRIDAQRRPGVRYRYRAGVAGAQPAIFQNSVATIKVLY